MSGGKTLIGCGSGRCGTESLASLIDNCSSWKCTHERKPVLPWQVDQDKLRNRINLFQDRTKYGDVAYYYLPYIEDMIRKVDDLVVVCLKRNKEDTVNSFMAKVSYYRDKPKNHWEEHDGERWYKDDKFDPTFPNIKAPSDLPQEEYRRYQISRYWEEYYQWAENMAEIHNNFRVFDIDVLNDRAKQEELFDYIGISNPTFNLGIRENQLLAKNDIG